MKLNKRYLALAFEALLFLLASLATFTCVASLANVVGSTDMPIKRMGPYYLSVLALIYSVFLIHLVLFPKSEAKLKLTLKVSSIVMAALAFLSALLIVINLASHEYSSFVSGVVTPLFPLDSFLWDLGLIALGVYLAIKGFRFSSKTTRVYYPYSHGMVRKIFGSFFRGFYLLIALYLTGAALTFIFIANYGSATWWAMLGLWLLMLVPCATLIYHDFFYKKPEGHSNEENRKIALIVLGGGLLLTFYFLLALLLRRNFIVEDATSLFLFDYMKSWNAAPYIVSLMANVPPLVAWLFALGKPKEKPQQNQGEAVQKPAETPEKIS